jgi:pyruvate ferredoxin oxidoreductase gamma subunit/2-oxoisovalerate ferredoxin oxidoreductase gamma subunit
MYEIRFHGRGGQGAVVASTVLASAFFKERKFVQAFPNFGAERRGAPVVAFTRVSDQEIRERFGIYEPDCLIILDSSLTRRKGITQGLKEGHWIIINSDRRPEEYIFLGPYCVATLDANTIAQKYGLGNVAVPIVNTTILGAFAKATRKVEIESIMDAVRENVPSKPEQNAKAALEAYEKVVLLDVQ